MFNKKMCLKIGGLVIIGVAVLASVVMGLWNWLMPALFGGAVATIGYLQALGLLVLSKILFGGFRGRGRHDRCGHGHGGFGPRAAAFANMTDEEKAAFKAKMRGRFCSKDKAEAE